MMMIRIIIKFAEKILKYKDLIMEIQRVWNVKEKVTSVISGVTGTISASFRHDSLATYVESTKSRNYKKQPYWALHTYFRKY
jgi:hypothetical protein